MEYVYVGREDDNRIIAISKHLLTLTPISIWSLE